MTLLLRCGSSPCGPAAGGGPAARLAPTTPFTTSTVPEAPSLCRNSAAHFERQRVAGASSRCRFVIGPPANCANKQLDILLNKVAGTAHAAHIKDGKGAYCACRVFFFFFLGWGFLGPNLHSSSARKCDKWRRVEAAAAAVSDSKVMDS